MPAGDVSPSPPAALRAGILRLTPAQCGQYLALMGAVGTAAATLHALCMPHADGATVETAPLEALTQLRRAMARHAKAGRPPRYVAVQAWAWSCAVLGSQCVAMRAHLAAQYKLVRPAPSQLPTGATISPIISPIISLRSKNPQELVLLVASHHPTLEVLCGDSPTQSWCPPRCS